MGFLGKIGDVLGNMGQTAVDAVTALPSTAIGMGMDLLGDYLGSEYIAGPDLKKSYKLADKNSAKAFERTYEAFKTRYQDTADDLRAAGLNPLLAVGSGIGVGSGATSSAGPVVNPNVYSSKGTGSALNLANYEKSKAKATETAANRIKIITEQTKNIQSTIESIARTNLIRQQQKIAKVEENTAVYRLNNMYLEYQEVVARTERASKEAMLAVVERGRVKELQDNLMAQTEKLIYQLNELAATSNVYSGKIGQILKYLQEIGKTFNINVGIIPGLKGLKK